LWSQLPEITINLLKKQGLDCDIADIDSIENELCNQKINIEAIKNEIKGSKITIEKYLQERLTFNY